MSQLSLGSVFDYIFTFCDVGHSGDIFFIKFRNFYTSVEMAMVFLFSLTSKKECDFTTNRYPYTATGMLTDNHIILINLPIYNIDQYTVEKWHHPVQLLF